MLEEMGSNNDLKISVDTPLSSAASDTDISALKLAIDSYWKEYQYRHSYAIGLFYKSVAIIFIIATIPYFHKGNIGILEKYSILFPLIVSPLTIISSWLIYAEFLRMRISLNSYKDATRRLVYADGQSSRVAESDFPILFRISIAKTLALFVLIVGLMVSVSSSIVILMLN